MIKITPVRGETKFRSPTPAQIERLKSGLRRSILDWLTNYVRHRVRDDNLQRGRAPIKGYSTNPIVIPHTGTLKPHRRPKGGIPRGKKGQFFPGGYLEYREKVGLSSAFSFYNTGDAWRDWRVLAYGTDISPGEIGFTKQENAYAAAQSENERPDLFLIDEQELSMVHIKVIEQINSTFFGASTP